MGLFQISSEAAGLDLGQYMDHTDPELETAYQAVLSEYQDRVRSEGDPIGPNDPAGPEDYLRFVMRCWPLFIVNALPDSPMGKFLWLLADRHKAAGGYAKTRSAGLEA